MALFQVGPLSARDYLQKVTQAKAPPLSLQTELFRAERFGSRPITARGLTAIQSRFVDANVPPNILIPADPRRRLLVFVAIDGNWDILPFAFPDLVVTGIHVGPDEPPTIIDETTWGAFTQLEWTGNTTVLPNRICILSEVYLS